MRESMQYCWLAYKISWIIPLHNSSYLFVIQTTYLQGKMQYVMFEGVYYCYF